MKNRTSRPIKQRKSPPIYAIVGDGYSEKIYFEQLKEAKQFKNIQKNLYVYLQSKLKTAEANAQFLEIDRDIQGHNFPRAEIFKLIQTLDILGKT